MTLPLGSGGRDGVICPRLSTPATGNAALTCPAIHGMQCLMIRFLDGKEVFASLRYSVFIEVLRIGDGGDLVFTICRLLIVLYFPV